jgi:hypothetical protein
LLLFPAHDDAPDPTVRIADGWDDDVAAYVEAGGRAVVVCARAGALPEGFAISSRPREGPWWGGDWAQGLGWVKPALRADLPLGPRVDLAFLGLTPEHLLVGYRSSDRDDVLAASYLGWLHRTTPTIAGFRFGDGAGILCTFPVLERDPLARALLVRLTAIAADAAFAPSRRLER